MDLDPELDVTLSDGRQSATFQITAVDGALEAWAILEPLSPLTVVVGRAAALETRARVDTLIAERLATGWVPVDTGPLGAPLVPPTPLPPDLVLQISHLLEALDRGRAALRAADPGGQLWAACVTFLRQARRFGVGAPRARVARAQRERRLGELADQAGDMPAAILHYRAAVAAHAGVGVRRRLSLLASHWPTATTRLDGPPSRRPTAARGLQAAPMHTEEATAGVTSRAEAQTLEAPRGRQDPPDHRPQSGRPRPPHQETTMSKKRIAKVQLVCRIDPALHAKVRAQAARAGQTLTTFMARALEKATGGMPATHAR